MDIKKFNKHMGRPKYSKGGYIKKIANRKYFDSGGSISNAAGALGMNAGYGNITPGTNATQLGTAYTNSANAANEQVGLQKILAPQAQTGVNAQNQVLNQELAMTQGQGPNPALNQLNQTTGTNVKNEAALLAGQRGSNENPGLAARNIATAGTQAQQGAVGQAATLEAQQQIAAQQNATNLANNQIGQAQGATTALNTAEQNEQNILQGANTAQNQANVGMQSNVNSTNAQTNQGILGGISSGLGAVAGLLNEGGEVQVHPDKKHKLEFIHKMTKLGMEHFDRGGGVSSSPSPSPSPTPSQSLFNSNPANAADVVPQNIDKSKMQNVMKGFNQTYADGGPVANPLLSGITNSPQSPQMQSMNYAPINEPGPMNVSGGPSGAPADLGKSVSQGYSATHKDPGQSKMNADASEGSTPTNPNAAVNDWSNLAKGGEIWTLHPHQHAAYSANHFSEYFAKGGETGKVPAMVSPGEVYLPPDAVERVKHGADPLKEGMRVPGKAKVKGDSLKNDTIPATLDVGGVVIDRKHVGHPDKARLFVLKSLKATGKHMKKPKGA